jgi:hypothetical protein
MFNYPEPFTSIPHVKSLLKSLFLFRCIGHAKEFVIIPGSLWHYLTSCFMATTFGLTPSPEAGDHPLSAVRNCLFYIFAYMLRIGRPLPPSETRGCAIPCMVAGDPPDLELTNNRFEIIVWFCLEPAADKKSTDICSQCVPWFVSRFVPQLASLYCALR